MSPTFSLLVALLLVGGGTRSLEVTHVGHGCCSAASPPTLEAALVDSASLPGMAVDTVRFSGNGAPRSEAGWVLVGPRPIRSLSLGNGGFLHLDPAALLPLRPLLVDSTGRWEVTTAIPRALLRPEQHLTVQAAFQDPGMSIDFALSDAIEIALTED